MQSTPRILPLHISMAASYWQSQFEDGVQDAADIQEEFHDMLSGIQKYIAINYVRDDAHLKCVFQDGQARLLKLKSQEVSDDKPVVFLVPSLINKAHIFDVTREQSMMQFFCDFGFDVYLLDWGDLLDDPKMQNLDDIILQKMLVCIQYLKGMSGQDIHALGYCMGGTMLASLASVHNEGIKSLTLLASPWDFHAGSQNLLSRVKFWSPSLINAIQDENYMKVDWVQLLFSSLYPEQAMKKFVRFSKMEIKSDAAQLFIAVEHWLNDGVALPKDVVHVAVKDWFLNNDLMHGQCYLNGNKIDAANIQCPTYIVASSQDKLVEFGSSYALHEKIKHSDLYDPECGHIGMIASQRARKNVWVSIAHWISKND
ncbi:MAG: alpha/beta fold hydrolase [Bdellovibrionales bacterium]